MSYGSVRHSSAPLLKGNPAVDLLHDIYFPQMFFEQRGRNEMNSFSYISPFLFFTATQYDHGRMKKGALS